MMPRTLNKTEDQIADEARIILERLRADRPTQTWVWNPANQMIGRENRDATLTPHFIHHGGFWLTPDELQDRQQAKEAREAAITKAEKGS